MCCVRSVGVIGHISGFVITDQRVCRGRYTLSGCVTHINGVCRGRSVSGLTQISGAVATDQWVWFGRSVYVVTDQVVWFGRSAGVLWQISLCVVADQRCVKADQRVCCGRSAGVLWQISGCVVAGIVTGCVTLVSGGVVTDQLVC